MLSDAPMTYRGWTLVNRGRFRFANKDNTAIYRRVCRDTASYSEAKAAFHRVVDAYEDNGER